MSASECQLIYVSGKKTIQISDKNVEFGAQYIPFKLQDVKTDFIIYVLSHYPSGLYKICFQHQRLSCCVILNFRRKKPLKEIMSREL